MFYSGLVSITLKELAVGDVVALVRQAGLDCIEWWGKGHVVPGDMAAAREARRRTIDAGLFVAAYGSYYRVGHRESGSFEDVLATAIELGTPSIRVWPGQLGSADADEAYWAAVVEDSRRIADMAAQEGIRIDYEYHAGTLTDTRQSARRLLEAVDHQNIATYWQPPRYSQLDENLQTIDDLLSWIQNLHVFTWHRISGERMALAAGKTDWMQYLQRVEGSKQDRCCMIEFVVDDLPENFLRDAATLKEWLSKYNRCMEYAIF